MIKNSPLSQLGNTGQAGGTSSHVVQGPSAMQAIRKLMALKAKSKTPIPDAHEGQAGQWHNNQVNQNGY